MSIMDQLSKGNFPFKVMKPPVTYFGIWILRPGLTLRVFGWLFVIKLTRNELFSQRQDTSRWRFFGLSIKLFG